MAAQLAIPAIGAILRWLGGFAATSGAARMGHAARASRISEDVRRGVAGAVHPKTGLPMSPARWEKLQRTQARAERLSRDVRPSLSGLMRGAGVANAAIWTGLTPLFLYQMLGGGHGGEEPGALEGAELDPRLLELLNSNTQGSGGMGMGNMSSNMLSSPTMGGETPSQLASLIQGYEDDVRKASVPHKSDLLSIYAQRGLI